MTGWMATPKYDGCSVHRDASEEVDHHFISALVSQYDVLERVCDETLECQEILTRDMYRRSSTPSGDEGVVNRACGADDVSTKSGTFKARSELSFQDISFQDFKEISALAKRLVPTNFVNGMRRFILNGCSFQASEIEECEAEVQILQFKMKEVEQRILDHVPSRPQEAIAKLRFIVGLLLDGGDFDVDYFAYQVDECACVLAASMS